MSKRILIIGGMGPQASITLHRKYRKILTVCCQHGNERFGVLVGFEVLRRGKDAVIGNPRAFIEGTRFFDTDINKTTFISQGGERDRAQLAKLIETCNQYDLIIDIHTTTSAIDKVAITGSNDTELLEVAARLGFSKAALMPDSVYKNALGGLTKPKVLSLEFGTGSKQDEEEAALLADKIISLDKQIALSQVDVYHISGTIPSKYSKIDMRNYQYSDKIKGYPFLVGETSYRTHAGFFADRKETVIIGGKI